MREYLPLVKKIARSLMATGSSPSVDVEDLVQIGCISLLDARERFEPERGVPLGAFVAMRARSKMIDHLRQISWPRSVRAAMGQPSDTHTPENRRRIKVLTGISKGVMTSEVEWTMTVPDSPDTEASRWVLRRTLAKAMCSMTKQERVAFRLMYIQDKTQAETAALMGVTASRVSQLHASGLSKIRNHVFKVGERHEVVPRATIDGKHK